MLAVGDMLDGLDGRAKAAFVSVGLFDLMIGAMAAVEQRGPELLQTDTDVYLSSQCRQLLSK